MTLRGLAMVNEHYRKGWDHGFFWGAAFVIVVIVITALVVV